MTQTSQHQQPPSQKKKKRDIITVAPNVSCCARVLFEPKLTGERARGCLVSKTIVRCDDDIRKVCVRHCRAVGWTAMFQGTGTRMSQRECSRCGLEDPSCLPSTRPSEFVFFLLSRGRCCRQRDCNLCTQTLTLRCLPRVLCHRVHLSSPKK